MTLLFGVILPAATWSDGRDLRTRRIRSDTDPGVQSATACRRNASVVVAGAIGDTPQRRRPYRRRTSGMCAATPENFLWPRHTPKYGEWTPCGARRAPDPSR